jgi:hypothetical protein
LVTMHTWGPATTVELAIRGGSGRGGDKKVLIGGSSERVREEIASVVIVVAGVAA